MLRHSVRGILFDGCFYHLGDDAVTHYEDSCIYDIVRSLKQLRDIAEFLQPNGC